MRILATTSAAVRVQSGWLTCTAMAVKRHSPTVRTLAGEFTTAVVMQTYQLSAVTMVCYTRYTSHLPHISSNMLQSLIAAATATPTTTLLL